MYTKDFIAPPSIEDSKWL